MSGVTPDELGEHAFLRGMTARHLVVLSRASWEAPVRAGHRLFEEGGTAHRFWLLRSGGVALDLHAPDRRGLIVDTLCAGICGLRPAGRTDPASAIAWRAAATTRRT